MKTLSNICGEGAREIMADVELPSVVLRQGDQSLTLHTEEQLCELMELIEECFTFFDAARQPKAQPERPNDPSSATRPTKTHEHD
jgi:hypothetical protein